MFFNKITPTAIQTTTNDKQMVALRSDEIEAVAGGDGADGALYTGGSVYIGRPY